LVSQNGGGLANPRTQHKLLDAEGVSDCIARMRNKIFLSLIVTVIVATGCAKTVSGRRTAAVPFVTDRVDGRYERPALQVYAAAKDVVRYNGTLVNEITQHNETNAVVYSLEGRVQERKVFIAVKEMDPKTSEVTVQVRTSAGGTDIELSHELEKQIALKLVR
jgi:hypothetical protein